VVARGRSRRGASTVGCLFTILILVALLYYGLDAGRIYWDYYRFRDEMETSARFASSQTDDQIRQHLRAFAQDLGLPSEAHRIVIRRTEYPPRVSIRTHYTVELLLPFTRKEITFTPVAEARQ
jgi:hypothetical protein